MSETTELAVLEIKPEQAPTLYVANGLDAYLDQIRELAAEVPDVTTKKGRDRIGSLARMVGSSKKAIEEPGRAYLKQLKEAVKPAEEELRRFTRECDTIRDKILAPRTEWDAEQDRIAAEEQMNAWHAEALEMNAAHDKAAAEKFESDHELALLMNKDFDREREEARAEAERQRIAHEDEIKRDRIANEQRLEREKLEAIEEEQRKAREQADRIKRENDAKEAARLAEEKRIADENARRAANVQHRKTINNQAKSSLIASAGLTEEQAIAVITAIAKGEVTAIRITY